MILDTNVFSELLKSRPDERVGLWAAVRPGTFTTAITIQESFYGIELLPASARRDELTRALERVLDDTFQGRVLPYTEVAARQTAALIAHRRRLGRPVSTTDAQIAGIAIEHGAILATRNARDFAGMPLEVVNPWHG